MKKRLEKVVRPLKNKLTTPESQTPRASAVPPDLSEQFHQEAASKNFNPILNNLLINKIINKRQKLPADKKCKEERYQALIKDLHTFAEQILFLASLLADYTEENQQRIASYNWDWIAILGLLKKPLVIDFMESNFDLSGNKLGRVVQFLTPIANQKTFENIQDALKNFTPPSQNILDSTKEKEVKKPGILARSRKFFRKTTSKKYNTDHEQLAYKLANLILSPNFDPAGLRETERKPLLNSLQMPAVRDYIDINFAPAKDKIDTIIQQLKGPLPPSDLPPALPVEEGPPTDFPPPLPDLHLKDTTLEKPEMESNLFSVEMYKNLSLVCTKVKERELKVLTKKTEPKIMPLLDEHPHDSEDDSASLDELNDSGQPNSTDNNKSPVLINDYPDELSDSESFNLNGSESIILEDNWINSGDSDSDSDIELILDDNPVNTDLAWFQNKISVGYSIFGTLLLVGIALAVVGSLIATGVILPLLGFTVGIILASVGAGLVLGGVVGFGTVAARIGFFGQDSVPENTRDPALEKDFFDWHLIPEDNTQR